MSSHTRSHRFTTYRFLNSSGQGAPIIVFLLLFLASAIGAAGYFYFEKESLTELHLEKMDHLNKKIMTLSEQLKERDLDNLSLKNNLANAEKETETYKARFKELSDLQLGLTEIKSSLATEFSKIQQTLNSNFGKVDDFSRSFDTRIEEYFNKSQRELSRIVEKREKPASEPMQVSEGQIELPKIVVNESPREVTTQPASSKPMVQAPAEPPQTEAADEGASKLPDRLEKLVNKQIKVMKVNQEHLFFVINKGLIDGVKVGQGLAIYRHDIKIGTATITEVRELISLAEIKEQYGGHFIEDGDIANLI